MVDGTILWAEWNMNSVLGEVFFTELSGLLTLQILKSFLLGQKAIVERRVSRQFVQRGRSLRRIRQHCVLADSSRFASHSFLEVRQSVCRTNS